MDVKKTNKCLWCGCYREKMKPQKINYRRQNIDGFICCDKCKESLKNYVDYVSKYFRLSMIWYVLTFIIGLFLVFIRLKQDFGAVGSLFIGVMIGLNLIIFPITVNILSPPPKVNVWIARVMGTAFVIAGFVGWYFLNNL